MRAASLPLASTLGLLLAACGEPRAGQGGTREVAIYPGSAGEVYELLYTRTVEFRVVEGTTERRVPRVETGDLAVPPFAEWQRPTFNGAELERIAALLERLLSERPLSHAPLLQRAFFARDLWMAFDEMSGDGAAYDRTQRLLARAVAELAPSRSELERIQAPPRRPPIPPDLGDEQAGWAELKAEHHEFWEGVRLPVHAIAARGHSYIRVFMKFDRGRARDHVERLAAREPIDLPNGIDVALLEHASMISRELEVVPTEVLLTYQSRRIEDPSSDVGDALELRYRRRSIFADWRDGGLVRTDPEGEAHCSLSISNPIVGGDTLERPLKARCAQCHDPKGWTNEAEMRARRFGSIRSLVPDGGGGGGSRASQIEASRRVLEQFGNLRRLRDLAQR
jgi:hypothetical protein